MAPFDWENFLIFAKELVESSSDETKLRTSIGRAYYYVFHLSCIFCKNFEIPIPQSINGKAENSKHLRVIHALRNYSPKNLNDFNSTRNAKYVNDAGKFLDSLKRRRINSDYEEDPFNGTEISKEASIAIAEADQIKDLLINKYIP